MKSRAANINRLPGIEPLGRIDQSVVLRRYQSGEGVAVLDHDTAGARAGAIALQAAQTHLLVLQDRRDLRGPAMVEILNAAHAVARIKASTGDHPERAHSTLSIAKLTDGSQLTDYLAESLNVSLEDIGQTTGEGLRIVTTFGRGMALGSVVMQYQASDRSNQALPFKNLAEVTLHDSHDFINLNASGPFRGEGNIVNVPGAPEALMADIQVVTTAMLAEYSGTAK